jgi:MoaA/NifB/PqqE/SkfB family radical SAM enzyme
MALHNSGGALLCCHSRTFLKDNDGQTIHWHTHSLEDAWNSPTRREIQDALTRGEQHPNCDACFSEENTGGKSRRQHHLDMLDITDATRDLESPLLLDLKLGNICNLACRTCNPYVSSKWYRDWWEVFERDSGRYQDYSEYLDSKYLTGRLSYDDSNEKFWQKLREWIPHVQYIDIYGAEPMMIDRLFEILRYSRDRGCHQHQTLHFNTNCTLWRDDYAELLGSFKRVFVDLSIDGLYQHYDYLRYGETWSVTRDNIDKYLHWHKKTGHRHHINICITVSILNIYYLDEITKYFDELGCTWHFNLAHMPHWVSIKTLPEHIKRAIADKLLANGTSANFQQRITPMISYMMEPMLCPHDQMSHEDYSARMWKEFVRSTLMLDRRRRQDFATTFPEFYQLLLKEFTAVHRLHIESESQQE